MRETQMRNTILQVNENHKRIDTDYFKNYGGEEYSKTYTRYTTPADYLIEDLLNNNIFFNTILDVGCASGELVRDLRRLGASAYGIENNKKVLDKCVVPEYCCQLDMKEIYKIPPETFDVIFTNSMMYCFPQEFLNILKMINRACKKAVYFYSPYLNESTVPDPYRVFLASKIWCDKQFEEANFLPVTNEIYKKI